MNTHNEQPGQPLRVLAVDDSKDDRFFVQRALQKCPQFQLLRELVNGDEAIAYLGGVGHWADRAKYPLPDLLLLDLKMPGRSGLDVLQWIHDHGPSDLVTAILSGSFLQVDVDRCLALGASRFYTKSSSIPDLCEMLMELEAILRPQPAAGF